MDKNIQVKSQIDDFPKRTIELSADKTSQIDAIIQGLEPNTTIKLSSGLFSLKRVVIRTPGITIEPEDSGRDLIVMTAKGPTIVVDIDPKWAA